ncbi:hypothetical protein [Romeriopsis navalis]|uniref:hypothetical protein n=1 Tax=Romeriopsis navalis TaxID=2992132 RepID=UPI0021F91561|nr:hypothetical protein [Romeriopsis navalis]
MNFRSKRVNNKATAIFKQNIHSLFSGNKKRVLYSIELRDYDRFSRDDVADINPGARGTKLFVLYEPSTGLVYDLTHKVIGRRGEDIRVRGQQGFKLDRLASITFRFNHRRL